MFEEWTDRFDPPSYHVVDPPRRVIIDLGQLVMAPKRFVGSVSLRVRNGGLSLAGPVPGHLHAWARTSTGGWIALVSCVVTTGNRQGRLRVQQWCSEEAVCLPSDDPGTG
ncbi:MULTISPECIES: hypothetical protein [Nocardia]|uniref:hypothetical protein n=1 Tax=Nocardia TaxID=1817 RepID=UPI001EF5BF99|nr:MULTISPECIES: hypothetical protein [Nocardia]